MRLEPHRAVRDRLDEQAAQTHYLSSIAISSLQHHHLISPASLSLQHPIAELMFGIGALATAGARTS
jgi:hypothetical protein